MLIAETQEFVKKANRFNYLNLLSISILPPPVSSQPLFCFNRELHCQYNILSRQGAELEVVAVVERFLSLFLLLISNSLRKLDFYCDFRIFCCGLHNFVIRNIIYSNSFLLIIKNFTKDEQSI